MKRIINAILVGIGLWSFSPGGAFACSCKSCDDVRSFTETEFYDFIGGGLVTSIGLSEDRRERIVSIEVLEELKGNGSQTIIVRTPTYGPACGAYFSVGSTIRVAAIERDGDYQTSYCIQRCWRSNTNSAVFTRPYDDEQDYPFEVCGR